MRFETRKYGAVPFWFWNGDQDESQISRQLKLAQAGGVRGLAVHARSGNRTEYMSARWLELVRHTCRVAKELGLEVWLYDEEGYPSGTVGGRLPAIGDRVQQKVILFDYVSGRGLDSLDGVLRIFRATDLLSPVQRADVQDEELVLVFWRDTLSRYIDALSRDVAEIFLDMTHRPYYEALGEYFGDPITFVYTDDLNSLLHGLGVAGLPYTDGLEEQFFSRYGYSMLDHLPALVEDIPECTKVRQHFRRFVLDVFLTSFVQPLYEWCEDRGVKLTGHLCGDEGPMAKEVSRFGSAMPFFEFEHVPGIDDYLVAMHDSRFTARLRNDRGMYPVLIHKMASSVANQLKGGVCGCEVLTSLGWGVPLVEQSVQLLFEHALGVNLLTHHDFSYATAGVAKRDHPASFFFQQPYWPLSREFHDQIARVSQLLQRGRCEAPVLVIHPISSCWTAIGGEVLKSEFQQQHRAEARTSDEIEQALAEISMSLLKSQVGYEYGDEVIMERHGRVSEDGLSIGDMTYRVVVIPPVNNLFGSTVQLLRQFLAAGGRVVAVQPGECLVDGLVPAQPVFGSDGSLAGSEKVDDIAALTSLELPRTLEIAAADGTPVPDVIVHTRVVDGSREYFLLNLGDPPAGLRVTGLEEEFEIFDPESNRVVYRGRTWPESFTMPRFSCCYILPAGVLEGVEEIDLGESLFAEPSDMALTIPDGQWRVQLEQPNVMLLDWCTLPDGTEASVDATGRLDAGTEVRLDVEIPSPLCVHAMLIERFVPVTVSVNGTPLTTAPDYVHPATQDLLGWCLEGRLRPGRNTFTLRISEAVDRLEPMYLLGEFGVSLTQTPHGWRPELTELSCGLGDLVPLGLPFYWGAVTYEARLEWPESLATAWLDLGAVNGAAAVEVNGQPLGVRIKPPYRFSLGGIADSGPNTIRVTLYNTAQNFFGPHRAARSSGSATPAPSRGDGENPYFLMPFGITGPVRVLAGAEL